MIAVALYAAIVLASGNTADGVLGQLGFATSAVNMMNAEGLNLPAAVAIDTSATPNRVYVADEQNSRVLAWRDAASFTNGAPADLVIGQPDFTSSSSVQWGQRYGQFQQPVLSMGGRGGRVGQPLRGGYRQQPGAGVHESV